MGADVKVLKIVRWEGRRSLKRLYQTYYSQKPRVKPPTMIDRREFAFQPFEFESYVRHIAFRGFQELKEYLASNAPRHAYYSVALYEIPEAKSMEEKIWLGSEILIDIDVDRLKGCSPLKIGDEDIVDDGCLLEGYKAALRVKKILERDLDSSSTVYFSGNRGFHVIGSCDYCLKLGRDERGEIASYISGLGLDIGYIMPLLEAGKGRSKALKVAAPSRDDPGWRGWLGAELESRGVAPGSPLDSELLKSLVEEVQMPIDVQVTRDPSRLARIVGSINGKASLLVVDVSDRDFRPGPGLSPFSGYLEVKALAGLEARILGYDLSFKPGETLTLEAPIALLLATKNIVEPFSGEVRIV
ncbi:MAG: DNA primase small subunit domain-containing protein [Acidilobaceae archaeon]